MRTIGIYSTVGTRADIGVFKSACQRWTDEIHPVGDGKNLAALLHRINYSTVKDQDHKIDHIIFAGHGGPDWWINRRTGVVTKNPKGRQISTQHLVDAIAPSLDDNILISMAACLCSRSPRWYLDLMGKPIGSDWGPLAYRRGGQASFSARIRDSLWWHGKRGYVRGHRAAGHATRLALLAEHSWPAGEACKPLFEYCLSGVEPILPVRRKWTNIVTGDLAERWLMGDDFVIDEIKARW